MWRCGDTSLEQACTVDSTAVEEICLVYDATHTHVTEDGAEMDEMWSARRGCYIAAGKVREQKGDSVYLSDTCVPISKLAESVAETEKDFVSNGFPAVICAHIADGTLQCSVHSFCWLDIRTIWAVSANRPATS
jgi:D-lactate dehydrogenase (cytochrome)